ncbi:hypothetical protein QA596_11695 [Balneolales bacterium ANBcel1]|nr:hypothetical protein [Balneolales bacterium ANBcel1]
MNKYRVVALSILIVAAIALRFFPHPPNFTPVAALALFSGVFFRDRFWAFAAPICVMLITDLFLGWHNTILFVYGSFAIMVWFGRAIRSRVSIGYVAGGGMAGAVTFFIITNFGVWFTGSMYPKTWEGLAAAYIAAIPFFHYMIFSTLFYSAVFFGVFLLAERYLPSIRETNLPHQA